MLWRGVNHNFSLRVLSCMAKMYKSLPNCVKMSKFPPWRDQNQVFRPRNSRFPPPTQTCLFLPKAVSGKKMPGLSLLSEFYILYLGPAGLGWIFTYSPVGPQDWVFPWLWAEEQTTLGEIQYSCLATYQLFLKIFSCPKHNYFMFYSTVWLDAHKGPQGTHHPGSEGWTSKVRIRLFFIEETPAKNKFQKLLVLWNLLIQRRPRPYGSIYRFPN